MSALTAMLGSQARFGEPLAAHTTWRVGGPAWCLATVESLEQARRTQALCAAAGMPLKVLGRGSNLLASDAGWHGVLLRMKGGLARLEQKGPALLCGGGAYLSAALKLAARLGLSGLEWAAGIPGTVGGALATNAGAHGGDMAATAGEASLLLPGGSLRAYTAAQLPAAYRRRELPAGALVISVRLDLRPDDPAAVTARVKAVLERRRASQPLAARTAGSVFRNPPGDHAGRLIQAAGLKGLAVGQAVVSPTHANFIENRGRASAAQIWELIDQVRRRVAAHSGVELIPEVEVLGHV